MGRPLMNNLLQQQGGGSGPSVGSLGVPGPASLNLGGQQQASLSTMAIGSVPAPSAAASSGGMTMQQLTPAPSGLSNPTSGLDELHILVRQLVSAEHRESVLLELSKKRESYPDLAPILWHTVGTVAALLQEIVSIYPLLTPPTLTAHASNRVCNALALLQCVASHPGECCSLPVFKFDFVFGILFSRMTVCQTREGCSLPRTSRSTCTRSLTRRASLARSSTFG